MTTIYYTAPYIPPEWIEAHGLDPERLNVPIRKSEGGGESISGVCPFARQMQNTLLLASKDAPVVLGTHCDQMRRLGELTAMRKEMDPSSLFLFQMPATWKTEAAAAHYRDELRRLSRFLVAAGGEEPDDDQLRSVIERSRTMWGQAGQSGSDPPLTGTSAAAESRPGIALLAGDSITTTPSLAELVYQAGGQVVLDATDRGERTRPTLPDVALMKVEPFEALARAYFDRIADSFRRPNSQLYEWLGKRMAEEKVQGLILHRYVWCDLWHAEAVRLKRWSNVPVLDLDNDGQWNTSLQTRLEAFLEFFSSAPFRPVLPHRRDGND